MSGGAHTLAMGAHTIRRRMGTLGAGGTAAARAHERAARTFPRLSAGVIDSSQYGKVRSTVSLRHSESGISTIGMCAYLLSLPGQ